MRVLFCVADLFIPLVWWSEFFFFFFFFLVKCSIHTCGQFTSVQKVFCATGKCQILACRRNYGFGWNVLCKCELGRKATFLRQENSRCFISRLDRVIHFFNMDNLHECMYSLVVQPDKPRRVACLAPSTLLYEDMTKTPPEVRWLDCSAEAPEPVSGNGVTHMVEVCRCAKLSKD